MKSAYPSSQSFFDASSDSIRAEDVKKCRTSFSCTSLSDLFSNPTYKSDLFPNAKIPVCVAEEVLFPAKKKRECEERTSIWHEWGSGECQTENVAQESSGLVSDLFRPSTSSSSAYCTESSRSSTFPNLGSANITFVPPEFSFPTKKNREEGSSWREERASWQDCSITGSHSNAKTDKYTPVCSAMDVKEAKASLRHCSLFPSFKSSVVSNMGAPISASEDSCFPARKKREERSFWQDCGLGAAVADENPAFACDSINPIKESSVSPFSDMYTRKPGSKCMSLFSNAIVSSTDEVVFPKRKDRVDRNVWRDWANTGYCDWEDGIDREMAAGENVNESSTISNEESSTFVCSDLVSPTSTSASINENWIVNSVCNSVVDARRRKRSQSTAWFMSNSGDLGADGESTISKADVSNVQFETSGVVNDILGDEMSTCGMQTDSREIEQILPNESERSMDGTESATSVKVRNCLEADEDFFMSAKLRCPRGFERFSKYPPPLGSLSEQESLRVPHHMPWVQLQPIRSEGRFMLQKVKVTQPVVFQPTRKEGRLVLNLIGEGCGVLQRDDAISRGRGGFVKLSSLVSQEVHEGNLGFDGERLPGGAGFKHQRSSAHEENERIMKPSKVCPQRFDEKDANEAFVDTGGIHFDECGYSCSPCDKMYRRVKDGLEVNNGADPVNVPPRVVLEVVSENLGFGSKGWLQSDVGFRERFPLSTLEADRLYPMGTISSFHTEKSPQLAEWRALSGSPILQNGLLGVPGQNDEDNFARSGRTQSHLDDFSSFDTEFDTKCDTDSDDGGGVETKFHLVCHGVQKHSLHMKPTHPFLLSLRTMPELPGDFDLRLSSFNHPLSTTFSCGDGVGKRRHEKCFWEQQPCVS